jgi:2-polyprenyl-6-methoxyphenol hydroxylase-like FAD-dependent oxidoreductase
MGEPKRDHAIVIGGSMGGLFAARVLSDHYARVTLVDRDAFPPVGQQRRGVPQGVHTHGLLASGRRTMDRWFPGFATEMIEAGALTGDIANDSRWFFEGGCLTKFDSGLEGLLVSRPLLEGMFRKRLFALPNLTVVENSVVEGLATSDDKRRVTGVRAAQGVTSADLVVDASGRGSHSPAWLDSLGFPKPEEERVEVAIGYTTRLFRRRKDHLNGDWAAVIPPTPEGKRGGVMLAQEGDRWTVTLIGYFGNSAPSDLPGFIEYAKTLPAPFIHEVVSDAEPLGDAFTARFPASVRRRYEKLNSFPEGYLVFGDAICSFNPIYGQGMSSAALQSEALDQALKESGPNFSARFFRRASKVIDVPWAVAVGADLRIPETVGPRNAGVNIINWYISKLHKAAHRDPVAAMAFHKVGNLLAAPESILYPRVAMRVFLGGLRSK